jgi:hypothetical protein
VDLLTGSRTRGEWVETGGGFTAEPPTLGVRAVPQTGQSPNQQISTSVIDTFIPGMILSLDRNQGEGGKPDHVFRRLYARAFSHTIAKGARTCQSCHNDPVALGFGEGTLTYELTQGQAGRLSHELTQRQAGRLSHELTQRQAGRLSHEVTQRQAGRLSYGRTQSEAGRWRFTAAQPPGPDGLPADAWVGFLQERSVNASTRRDVRPFIIDEQKRILTVGACLTCHAPSSRPMRSAVEDWKGTLAAVSPRCVLPRWQ